MYSIARRMICTLALCAVACSDDGGDGSGGGGGDFSRDESFPEVFALYAVWSFAPDDVWVAADGRMLHFTGSWDEVALPGGVTVVDLWSPAPGELLGVGGSSLVRFDGASWTVEDLSGQGLGASGFGAIWASGPDDVWIAGDQSTVAHYDGAVWTRMLAAGPDNQTLWGTGTGAVYTASVFETAVFDGTAWTTIEDIDGGGGAEAIFGFDDDDVWVADGDTLWHFDGASWERFELDGIGGVTSLWGNAPDDLWGAGDFGSIVRWNGESWREVENQRIGSPFLRVFNDIHGSARGDVWAVGAELGDAGNTPIIFRKN